MRNFLQFIWNNQFTFLFFLLEFLGFLLLTTNNPYHKSKVASTSVAITGNIAEVNYAYEQYLGLREENLKLLEENARLKERGLETASQQFTKDGRFQLSTAQVIQSTYKLGNNFLIINRGLEDGIEPQQGVLGPEGAVGIVYKVSNEYSAIMPIIHSQSMLSCKLGTTGYFGILKWDGKDERFAVLEDIPNHVRVAEGEPVLTRGASGALPANVLVGKAVAAERNESLGFQTVRVQLATDFQRIGSVYIIQNETKPTLDSLKLELEGE